MDKYTKAVFILTFSAFMAGCASKEVRQARASYNKIVEDVTYPHELACRKEANEMFPPAMATHSTTVRGEMVAIGNRLVQRPDREKTYTVDTNKVERDKFSDHCVKTKLEGDEEGLNKIRSAKERYEAVKARDS